MMMKVMAAPATALAAASASELSYAATMLRQSAKRASNLLSILYFGLKLINYNQIIFSYLIWLKSELHER